jgi:hypothetical protein
MKKSINRYNTLMSPHLWKYNSNLIESYIPEPSEFNYRNTFLKRYFVRKSNDVNGVIYEIEPSEFSKYTNNPLYIAVEIVWKISGVSNETAREMNRRNIEVGRSVISNLHLYLVNVDQFYKEVDF